MIPADTGRAAHTGGIRCISSSGEIIGSSGAGSGDPVLRALGRGCQGVQLGGRAHSYLGDNSLGISHRRFAGHASNCGLPESLDALFDIERRVNGDSAERRRQVRQEASAPLVTDFERWLRQERPKLSRGNDLAKAMDYLLKRWPAFTRFLDDGRISSATTRPNQPCAV